MLKKILAVCLGAGMAITASMACASQGLVAQANCRSIEQMHAHLSFKLARSKKFKDASTEAERASRVAESCRAFAVSARGIEVGVPGLNLIVAGEDAHFGGDDARAHKLLLAGKQKLINVKPRAELLPTQILIESYIEKASADLAGRWPQSSVKGAKVP